jgi:hypothetical protein
MWRDEHYPSRIGEEKAMSSEEQLIFSLRQELAQAKEQLQANLVWRSELAKAKEELATMKSLYEEQVGISGGMRETLKNIASYTEKLKKG